jgi:hypothetical protein
MARLAVGHVLLGYADMPFSLVEVDRGVVDGEREKDDNLCPPYSQVESGTQSAGDILARQARDIPFLHGQNEMPFNLVHP